MNNILYSRSFATTATMGMILIMASIVSVAPELLKQAAIASIGQGNTTTTATPTGPNNATQRVSVGGGNVTFSVNQFSPQITEIQPGESVTFFAPNGSIEPHNIIFDLTNGTTISDLWLPFTLPSDTLGGEVPTDVSEELLLALPYNLGEPMIRNITRDDGTAQAIIGLNKVAWQPAVVDQNDNVIYLQEQELSQQMRQVEEAFQGGPQPSPLSTNYTMDGTERIISSGIILDVNGFATLEELFPEEGQGEASQDEVAAENNQEIATNSTTTTSTISPEGGARTQQEQPIEEFPPSPFPLLGSFTVTFNEPGTYDYFCAFHPGMFGQVVVGSG
ncbi:MAG TPA: plastocyanin/azurin family copper-binding protein [Nitrososphaera sp.]|nr:plastocyanin/azurin family copper-binding protein [Nitrososphaera sp.]